MVQDLLPPDGGAFRDAERDREARAGVARGEGVVLAFAGLPKSRQPAFETYVLELLAAARHQLVGVALVGGVPHDAVDGTVEGAVERQRELDDPKVRGQVAPALGDHRDDGVPHLLRDLGKFVVGERLEVLRCVDPFQQAGH